MVNAIYFKGNWKYQFQNEKTKIQAFRVNQNRQVKGTISFYDFLISSQILFPREGNFYAVLLFFLGQVLWNTHVTSLINK